MGPIDLFRDALFGNPPSPTHQPSREGSLAAFTDIAQRVAGIVTGIPAYPTAASLPSVTAADNGKQARVFADTVSDNNVYWIVRGGAWTIDSGLQAMLVSAVSSIIEGVADRLNRWQVQFFDVDRIVVDPIGNVVRYPGFLLLRDGEPFVRVRPEDYGLTTFDLPLVPFTSGTANFHYVDVDAVGGSESPVKAISGGVVLAENLVNVPLGYSVFGVYQSAWAQDFTFTNRPSHSLLAINGPAWVYDLDGLNGPPNSIYVYPDAPIYDFETGGTIATVSNEANVSSGIYAGYCRLERQPPGTAEALLLDVETGAVWITGFGAVGPALADKPGRVRILAVWYGSMLASTISFATPATAAPPGSDPIAARDAANIARSNAVQSRRVTWVQRATASYNALIVHGQSLAVGQETWPALSKTPRFGNKMLGDVVHSANTPSPAYLSEYFPFGDDAFRDLKAVATNGLRTAILSDAEVAALSPGDAAYGEVPAVGFVNAAKFLHNQARDAANDGGRTFVAASVGLSGNSIETFTADGEFFRNGAPASSFFTFWPRYPDLLAKLSAAAGPDPIAITAMLWMQGENNAIPGFDGASSLKGDYKLNLNKLIDDHHAATVAAFGDDQALPFSFLTYQTGASYIRDADENGAPGLSVSMAQLEVSNERNDTWMVGPVYPVTDKGGHLDSNGSRWFAEQAAKVYDRVVTLGLDWKPLQPTRITQSGTTILIDYHVPVGPLVFDTPYVVNAATTIADKGFRVTDGSGAVPVTSVTLAGDTIVQIMLGRATTGAVHVWYASEAHGGAGMLRDSDPSVALTKYEYAAGTGMYPSANIAALVGKPYPLWNWSVAFYLPVGFGA